MDQTVSGAITQPSSCGLRAATEERKHQASSCANDGILVERAEALSFVPTIPGPWEVAQRHNVEFQEVVCVPDMGARNGTWSLCKNSTCFQTTEPFLQPLFLNLEK